ncbi:MAG TPA: hypothetical protein VGK16_09625 [Candidatus Limnocylindrales bacterium]|jgi:hypothetical protein
MPSRFAPVLAAAITLLVVGACAAAPIAPASSPVTAPTVVPAPTPVPTAPPEPTPTPSRNAGDVDGQGPGAELTVEFPKPDLLDVTLQDERARAWRVVVTGTSDLAQDRMEVVVEAGDVGPVITATEIQQGELVGSIDLSGYLDATMAAGGCHHTLDVCIDSSAFQFSDDGTGRLRIRLQMPDPAAGRLLVTGGTAGWPGEPFVLGPWTDTDSFPWGD